MALSETTLARQRVFQSAFFSNAADYAAMYELAKMWHFFDPICATEEARIKRQCFMEILICSGMWPAGDTGMAVAFEAFKAMATRLRTPQTEGPPK